MYQYNQCLYCINKTDRHDVTKKTGKPRVKIEGTDDCYSE